MIAQAVYILCAVTSFVCAALLLRQYLRSRTRLLLWCCVCFVGLAFNNLMLVIDLLVVPSIDLSLVRTAIGLAALVVLLYGLVWDAR